LIKKSLSAIVLVEDRIGGPVTHGYYIGRGAPLASAKSDASDRTEVIGFCDVNLDTIRRNQVDIVVVRSGFDGSLLLTSNFR